MVLMLDSPILLLFYFLAAISIWLGLLSLRKGVRFVRYLQAESAKEYPEFTPPVTVFVPCRGVDNGLKENVSAIFAQDYPAFEIVFLGDREDDPAFSIVEEARRLFTNESCPTLRIVIAGPSTARGQKAHNPSMTVTHAGP